ncbi:PilW family protein [Enterovibrio norvegicus]|uniref:PilW family protein n=1 Tax=Enterovibrio norvegicus TaxID=188144 RepID=UPI000C860167|nr:prepilin-type N-terminal cleavage/methylation domain-containing protein [Enterovibrio norvegicus]PML78483.1 MSHA biogenesis protein MshO [Enterovibrio norvegicus]
MKRYYQSGFTLVELIVTMTILAIVSVGIFGFIESSTSGYVESKNREALQSQARFVVERLGRELRHAVPNSIETSDNGQCLVFTPVRFTGLYNTRVEGDASFEVGMSTTDADWGKTVGDGKHRLVFSPMKPDDLAPKNNALDPDNSFTITSALNNQITVSRNLDAPWPLGSPSKRFYVYSNFVTFCFGRGINSDSLVRRVNGSNRDVTLAQNLTNASGFSVDSTSLSRRNVVKVVYHFSQSGETSVYNQNIQVMNAP